jgi:hypothetical protein
MEWLMNVEQFVKWELAGKTKVLGKNLLSTTIPTWPDLASDLRRRSGRPAINSLSYGKAHNHL